MSSPAITSNKFVSKCETEDLSCIVCCNPYLNPHTINKCLHTFCKKCIESLENCPQCRIPFTATNLLHDFDKEKRIDRIKDRCLKRKAPEKEDSSEDEVEPIKPKRADPKISNDESEEKVSEAIIAPVSVHDTISRIDYFITQCRYGDASNLVATLPDNRFGYKTLVDTLNYALCNWPNTPGNWPNTPDSLIQALLSKTSLSADTLYAAASTGNIRALQTILKWRWTREELKQATQFAFKKGRVEAFDLFLSQTTWIGVAGVGILTTKTIKLSQFFNPNEIVNAYSNNLEMLKVVNKHYHIHTLSNSAKKILSDNGIH